MRRGFWKDLDDVFASALEMVGGTFDPENGMDEEIARIEAFKKEVRRAIRAADGPNIMGEKIHANSKAAI